MKNTPAGVVFDTVRWVRLASEKVTKGDLDSFSHHFSKDCKVFHTHSSSETGNITQAIFTDGETQEDHTAHIGKAAEGISFTTVDEQGIAVDPRTGGEIVVISHFLSPGYWHAQELTDARFFHRSDGTPAFKTGDLCRLNNDGNRVIEGRRDHQVKSTAIG